MRLEIDKISADNDIPNIGVSSLIKSNIAAIALAVGATVSGCFPSLEEECRENKDCNSGQTCMAGACIYDFDGDDADVVSGNIDSDSGLVDMGEDMNFEDAETDINVDAIADIGSDTAIDAATDMELDAELDAQTTPVFDAELDATPEVDAFVLEGCDVTCRIGNGEEVTFPICNGTDEVQAIDLCNGSIGPNGFESTISTNEGEPREIIYLSLDNSCVGQLEICTDNNGVISCNNLNQTNSAFAAREGETVFITLGCN